MEYGHMWHTCEESLAAKVDWEAPLKKYCQRLCLLHPLSQTEIEKWYQVCKHQFPIYIDYWKKQPEVLQRTPLLQEYKFDVPYQLPSGRVVRLRGKFDSVDLIGKGKAAGIYLQENKTKGDIAEQKMQRQLKFDLQTMLYLIALQELTYERKITGERQGVARPLKGCSAPVLGVRYNVIRRPLSGGKGNIKQLETRGKREAETKTQYYARLQQYFIDEPEYWFMRWKLEVSSHDIEKFQTQFLNPFLDGVCDWYEWVSSKEGRSNPFESHQYLHNPDTPGDCTSYYSSVHWTTPFGLYNVLAEGGTTEYDSYLETGNEVGLTRVDKLFGEL
jgi:hypothetical protein